MTKYSNSGVTRQTQKIHTVYHILYTEILMYTNAASRPITDKINRCSRKEGEHTGNTYSQKQRGR